MKIHVVFALLFGILFSALCVFSGLLPSPGSPQPGQISSPSRTEAAALLQKGFHLWDPEILKSGRDRLLALHLTEKTPDAELPHLLALADYRLAGYYLAAQNAAEAERYSAEARKYGEQARDKNPGMGESYALEAYLIGIELALHPDRALSLVPQSLEAFNVSFAKSPSNPRVYLLKALSVYYTPEPFGGGPAPALEFLDRALALFEKEKSSKASGTEWGEEEAYAYLGLCHKRLGNAAKARDMLKKALEVSPDYAFAAHELRAIPDK